MPEPQTTTFQDTLDAAVISIADRMRARPEPRKRRQRVKHREITEKQAVEMSLAWRFAVSHNVGPSLFVTVNWSHAPAKPGCPSHPVDRNGRLKDGLKAFLNRNGVPIVWIEVREKTRALGEHVHLAYFVPDHLREQFALRVRQLVARQSDSVTDTAIDVRPVGPRWWDRRDYMLKAASADVRASYRTSRFKKGSQGVIEGPRVRVAHSIGPTARKAAESAVGGVFNASDVA